METQEPKKSRLQRLRQEQQTLRKEIKDKTIGYVLAAFGLVAALAWNEAIKSFIDQFLPHTGGDILAKFAYAILVTIFIVIITVYLIKFTNKPEEKK